MKLLKFCSVFYFISLTTPAVSQFVILHNFTGKVNDGGSPRGDLISDGTYLYGLTERGGKKGHGVLFKIRIDDSVVTKMHDFNLTDSNGGMPYGSLLLVGNYLYGTTHNGGSSIDVGAGTIFKIKTDGSGFSTMHVFNGNDGSGPVGTMVTDGTWLYGMCNWSGSSDNGTIYKIKMDGSGFKVLHYFSKSNGSNPYGSLFLKDTFLYGMTWEGGKYGFGVIFKIRPDGNGYYLLHNFNDTNGRSTEGNLISIGKYLYGMSAGGYVNKFGLIFKITENGKDFSKIRDFNDTSGAIPTGSLIYDGNWLFGMTHNGGSRGRGVIFKIKPDGNNYTMMHDFVITNGENPLGSLTLDGGWLYGMTVDGGLYGHGVIFKIKNTTVGIEENNLLSQFTLYPNPAQSTFTINHTSLLKEELNIYNVLGEVVYTTQWQPTQSEKTIDISQWSKGIYLMRCGSEVGKFVVE